MKLRECFSFGLDMSQVCLLSSFFPYVWYVSQPVFLFHISSSVSHLAFIDPSLSTFCSCLTSSSHFFCVPPLFTLNSYLTFMQQCLKISPSTSQCLFMFILPLLPCIIFYLHFLASVLPPSAPCILSLLFLRPLFVCHLCLFPSFIYLWAVMIIWQWAELI